MSLRTTLLSAAALCGTLAAAPAFAAGIGMTGNTIIRPPAATTSATGNVTAPTPGVAPVTGTVRDTASTAADAAKAPASANGGVSTGTNTDPNASVDAGADAGSTASTPNDATRHGDHPAASSASGHVGTDTRN